MMSVKAFGEAEFWFAMIKVATILIFMGVAIWASLTQSAVGEYTAGVHNISESGGWFPEGLAPVFALALPYNAYSSEVSPLRFLLLSHRRASRGRHHAGRRPHGRRLVLRARSRW